MSADGFAPGEITTAFRQLQRITGRPETGVYDESIVSISRPHRGTAPPASSSVQKRWASEAKWRHNNIMYRYRNFTSDLPPGAQKKIVKSAFGFWTAITPSTMLIYIFTSPHSDHRATSTMRRHLQSCQAAFLSVVM